MPSRLHPAADRDAGHAGGLGPARDTERGLAVGRLRVDPALAGDDEVGPRESRVEVGRVHDEVDPGPKRERTEPILDRQQGKPDTSGRARPGRQAFVAAGRHVHRVGEAGKSLVQVRDLRRRGALLRPVDRRGPRRAEQRVRHVARDLQLDAAEPGIQPAEIDRRGIARGRRTEARTGAPPRRRSWRCRRCRARSTRPRRRARPAAGRPCRPTSRRRSRARPARAGTAPTPRPSRRRHAGRPGTAATSPGSIGRADREPSSSGGSSRRPPRSPRACPPRRPPAGRAGPRRRAAREASHRPGPAPPRPTSVTP